jgi:hypothetical protein
MPLIKVTAADGTESEVAGISLGDTGHPDLEQFIIIDASGRVVAYSAPSQAAKDAAAKANAPEEAAEATDKAGWKFDPVTGQPVTSSTDTTPVTPFPAA